MRAEERVSLPSPTNNSNANPLVSVVLLNFNGGAFLRDCVDHVLAQDYANVEIILVDNASGDGSMDLVEEARYASVVPIVNDANIGFSRAMNRGIAAAGGEYLLPLNFDVLLRPQYIGALVAAMEADVGVGSATGKLLRFDVNGPTGIVDSAGHAIYTNRYVRNIGEGEPDEGQFDAVEEVFGITGAAPVYRRAMLDDIAYDGEIFDESFFIMTEDVDIDWRARLRGWRSLRVPAATALHWRGGAGGSKSTLVRRHYFKNRYLLMQKNDAVGSYLRHWPAIFVMDVYLTAKTLLTAPQVLLLAWYDIIRLLPLTIRKRRQIQGGRKTAPRELDRWFRRYRWSDDFRRKMGKAV